MSIPTEVPDNFGYAVMVPFISTWLYVVTDMWAENGEAEVYCHETEEDALAFARQYEVFLIVRYSLELARYIRVTLDVDDPDDVDG